MSQKDPDTVHICRYKPIPSSCTHGIVLDIS